MKLREWVAVGVLAAAACGCGSDDDQVDIQATTYNAGLAVGFVDYAPQRSSVTVNALAALPTKILCVQEFWDADDVGKLKAATANSLPHTIFPAPQQEFVSGEAQCTTADLAPLEACVESSCACTPNEQLANCTLANCLPQFLALPPKCSGCLQANVGLVAALGLDRIIEECTATQTAKYAYDGSFGTGLLTKYEILEQEEVVMDSHTNRRGLIYARLKTEVGDLHTICTHLTAVFSDIPFPEAAGSWAEEQAAQIDELIAFVNAKAGSGGKVLVLGDMNTGPAGKTYSAEVPANYAKFAAAGLADAYIRDGNEPCTFCGTNPLVGEGTPSVVIDHILTRGLTASAHRIMESTVNVSVTTPACGGNPGKTETVLTAYSDHYGLQATIK